MKKFKFTIRGNQYDVKVHDIEDNVAHVEVNGTEYAVEIHQEVKQNKPKTPKLVRSEVKNAPTAGKIPKVEKNSTLKVVAPLPGSILKIFVSEGDQVNEGANLLMMEAMKMENNVLAEKTGTVASIRVAVGDTVLQNDIMLEIIPSI